MAAISWDLLGLVTGRVSEIVREDEFPGRRRVGHVRAGRRRRTAGRHARGRLRAGLFQPDQVRRLAHRDRRAAPSRWLREAGARAAAAKTSEA
jgi:hypothetical protein